MADEVTPGELRFAAARIRNAVMVLRSTLDSDVDGESPDTMNLLRIADVLEREALGCDNIADALEKQLAQR